MGGYQISWPHFVGVGSMNSLGAGWHPASTALNPCFPFDLALKQSMWVNSHPIKTMILQWYCNICNNITCTCMHNLFCRQPWLFWYQQKITCLIGMSNFLTGFFFFKRNVVCLKVFLILKMSLLRLIWKISHKPKSSLYNEHVAIATSQAFSQSSDVSKLRRKAPRSYDMKM